MKRKSAWKPPPGATVKRVNVNALAAAASVGVDLSGAAVTFAPLPDDASEAEWQARVVAVAESHGWTVYHTRDSRGSNPGLPDLFFHRGPGFVCRLVVAELKSETGEPTTDQLAMLAAFESVCQHVYLWRPSDWPTVLKVLTGDHLVKQRS